jgi:hypothetical protein
MTTHFFAAPDFLELLQFWDASRDGRPLPDWSGDIGVVPAPLLPNLVISDRRSEPFTYLYIGQEVVRRWGSDPTGKAMYDDVLKGAHRDYIKSLGDAAMARRAPIFSAAVYQHDPEGVVMTGRIYAPFTYRGSAGPEMMMTLQLFHGPEGVLHKIGLSGIVHEIRRDLIAMVPEVCARLEDARRYYQLSRHTHQRGLASHIDRIAEELAGNAMVPLPCLDVSSHPLPCG